MLNPVIKLIRLQILHVFFLLLLFRIKSNVKFCFVMELLVRPSAFFSKVAKQHYVKLVFVSQLKVFYPLGNI